MSIITADFSEELLIKSLRFFVKYKELGYKINTRMLDIHPLLFANDKHFKTNLHVFKRLYEAELGQPINVYKNQDNELHPYPANPLWISASGRFVGLDSSALLVETSEDWQFLLFDMELYEFVYYAWQDLLGIDESTKSIIGRSMKICGNETQDNSVYTYSLNTRNQVTKIKSKSELADQYTESKIYYTLPDLNQLFLLSDQRNLDGKLMCIKDFILEKREFYADAKGFQSICDSLIFDFYDRYDITEFSNAKKLDFTFKLFQFQNFLKAKALPF
jgi:hypothetical protein